MVVRILICLLIALAWNTLAFSQDNPTPESRWLANIRQVTSGFDRAGEGYFSADGQRIIYQAVPAGYPFYQIYTQPLSGGDPKRISPGRGRTTCSYFSPDGKHVLFASSHLDPNLDKTEADAKRQAEEDRKSGVRRRYQWDFDPYMDIFQADPDGTNLKQLTNVKGYDAEGAYSADGNLIAFCSDRDGDADIYLMNADGSNVRQLTNVPGYDGGPFISPDGKWIIFRSDRKKAEYLQIFVMNLAGEQQTALTDSEGVHWGPYWHPQAPYVIWSGADHSNPSMRPNYDLWLAKYEIANGKNGKFAFAKPQRVTDFSGADVLPVFSPSGKQLMWTSTRTADHTSQLFIADFRMTE